MKRQFFILAALLMMGAALKAQVGIGTNSPKASLDVVAEATNTSVMDGIIPPRLTGDQLGAKIYTADQTGAIVYVTQPRVTATNAQVVNVTTNGFYQFDGVQWGYPIGQLKMVYGNLGAGVNDRVVVSSYTGSTITLPPGKWLVTVQMIVRFGVQSSPTTGSYWVRTTFTDSPVTAIPSADIVGTTTLISANFSGPAYYSMMNGSLRINNTAGISKTYHFWKDGGGLEDGGTDDLNEFGANTWSENIIYAIPYEDAL